MLNEAEKESQLALGHPLSILDSHPTSRCQTVYKFLSKVATLLQFQGDSQTDVILLFYQGKNKGISYDEIIILQNLQKKKTRGI